MPRISLGERLKALRKEHKFTQETLALNSGVSQALISNIESGKLEVSDGAGWIIANLLKMTYKALLAGTDMEFKLAHLLSDRFCFNHDNVLFIPRMSHGGENKFCIECGKETIGDCPKCGTPFDDKLSDFCYVCGTNLISQYPKQDSSSKLLFGLEEYSNAITNQVYDAVLGFSEPLFHSGPIKLCPSIHMKGMFMENEREPFDAFEAQYKWPAFGLFGPMNYCPDCGRELLEACPKCGKHFELYVSEYKEQNLTIRFCSACGFDIGSLAKATNNPEK